MDRREFVVSATAAVTATVVPALARAQAKQPLSAVRGELAAALQLDARQRTMIVDAAINVVQQLYVHRAMKTALYGTDVVALLRGLRGRAAAMDDASFHRQMRRAFAQLHDRHASYSSGLRNKRFVLGITIDQAFEGGVQKFFIIDTEVAAVPVGSEIRHWNGTPVDRVIDEVAEDIGAGNETSRKAVARRYLTQRPSSKFDMPAEEWVRLEIVEPGGTSKEVQLRWDVDEPQVAAPAPTDEEGLEDELGLDEDFLQTYSPPHKLLRRRLADARARKPTVWGEPISVEGRSFGYLRFEDFTPETKLPAFLAEVRALLRTLPPTGLVIDIRGNPGGQIPAGECVIQFFTDKRVTPHGYRFRASDTTELIAQRADLYNPWLRTIAQARQFGSEHSTDIPLDYNYNEFGRAYPGPSILLVDAITYSTADMFTSSYQYHGIGEVICTDDNIGAGGANVWKYHFLLKNLPGFLVAASHETELEARRVSAEMVAEFGQNGRTISTASQVRPGQHSGSRKTWLLREGDATYRLTKGISSDGLAVFYPGANPLFPELPPRINFRFSMRQAIRKGNAEGMILEDAGIVPDHFYKRTKEDLFDGDKNLLAFACSRLPR